MSREHTRNRVYDRDIDILQERRKIAGQYLKFEDMEFFQTEDQYIDAMCTFYLDVIGGIKKLMKYPKMSEENGISKIFSKRHGALESLKKISEERNGEPFGMTKFYDEEDLTENERHVANLLFSMHGLGISPEDTSLSGQEIIHAIHSLNGGSMKDLRKMLTKNSRMEEKNILYVDDRDGGRRSFFNRYTRGPATVESNRYLLSEYSFLKMCGDMEGAEHYKPLDFKRSPGLLFDPDKQNESSLVKMETDVYLEDVELPPRIRKQVGSIAVLYDNKEKYYEDWGMDALREGRGLTLLFTGPPGTGKSMTAKAIANAVDLEVYQLAFDKMVNCYYGNTEKNVQKVFDDINEKKAVLIIDEVDGILTKRGFNSSVSSVENRIVDIFLKELEKHDGLIILTSNFAKNMDRALIRRIDIKIEFPMPDAEARKVIWEKHIPDGLPLGTSVDLEELATRYEMSGGQIRNAVMNAAREAFVDGKQTVGKEYFIQAIKDELDQGAMNYSLDESDEDIGGYL